MPKITIFSTCMMLMSMLLFYTPVSHAQSLSSKQTMVNQQNQNNTTTQFSEILIIRRKLLQMMNRRLKTLK